MKSRICHFESNFYSCSSGKIYAKEKRSKIQIAMREYENFSFVDDYVENKNVLDRWMKEHPDTSLLYLRIPTSSENRTNFILGVIILLFASPIAIIATGSLIQSMVDRISNGDYSTIVVTIFSLLFAWSILGVFIYVGYVMVFSSRYFTADVISRELFYELYVGKKRVRITQALDMNDIIGVAGFYSSNEGGVTGIQVNLFYIFNHNPYKRRSTLNLMKYNIYNRIDEDIARQFKLYREKEPNYEYPQVVSVVLQYFSLKQELEAIEFTSEIERKLKSEFLQFKEDLELNSYCVNCKQYQPWLEKYCSVCGNENIRNKFIPL